MAVRGATGAWIWVSASQRSFFCLLNMAPPLEALRPLDSRFWGVMVCGGPRPPHTITPSGRPASRADARSKQSCPEFLVLYYSLLLAYNKGQLRKLHKDVGNWLREKAMHSGAKQAQESFFMQRIFLTGLS